MIRAEINEVENNKKEHYKSENQRVSSLKQWEGNLESVEMGESGGEEQKHQDRICMCTNFPSVSQTGKSKTPRKHKTLTGVIL